MAFREFTPAEWIEELESGLDYRRRFGLEDVWGEMESTYYNVHPSMANDGPNIFLSTGDSMLSSITVPAPRISVRPSTPEAVPKSRLVEALDNVLLRELDLAHEVDRAALHAFLFGRGVLKAGYDSEFGYDPSQDVLGGSRIGLTLTQLDRRGKRRIEYDQRVSPGMPWVRAIPPHDVIIPWGILDFASSPWIATRVVRHIDDLRADTKYENTRDLQPTLSMEDFVNSYRSASKTRSTRTQTQRASQNNRKPEYVEFYEIQDRRTAMIYVVTNDWSRFLRRDLNALQIDNVLPFATLSFTPIARTFWTTPDVYYLRYGQMELSDIAVQRSKQRRASTLKFLYEKGSISEEELLKALSSDVAVGVGVEPGYDVGKALVPMQNVQNQALILEEEHIRRNLREQIGFSRNQVGEFTGGRRTATEAAIVDKSSALRMSRRGLQVKRLYEDIIRVVNGIVFEHWRRPRYIEVLGEAQASIWEAVTGPELRERYHYEVEFVDDAELQSRRIQALQLYAQLLADPAVDQIALRQFLISEFNDPSFERIFRAAVPVPMQNMSAGGGGVPPGRRPQPSSSMLPTPNGTGAVDNAAGLMAAGRNRLA